MAAVSFRKDRRLEMVGFIADFLLGLDVFESVTVLANGKGGFWDALNIVAMAMPGSGSVRAIGKAAKYGRRARAATKGLELLANLKKWSRGYDRRLLAAAKKKYPKLAAKTHLQMSAGDSSETETIVQSFRRTNEFGKKTK